MKILKFSLKLFVVVLLFSCSENESKQTVSEGFTNKNDTLVIENVVKRDSVINPKIQTATEVKKELLEGKSVDLEQLTFSNLLDSLNHPSVKVRSLYFKAITKSLSSADGPYAEAVGFHVFNMFVASPEELLTNLNALPKNEQELWFMALFNELSMRDNTVNPKTYQIFNKTIEKYKVKYPKYVALLDSLQAFVKERN